MTTNVLAALRSCRRHNDFAISQNRLLSAVRRTEVMGSQSRQNVDPQSAVAFRVFADCGSTFDACGRWH
jgi:hypothetical protein